MKRAIVTVVDSDFLKGFMVLIFSLLEYNTIDCDVYIIDAGLSENEKEFCKTLYSNISFITPHIESYNNFNWKVSKKTIWKSFYKLELFKLSEYDQIVAIDSDMLILGDISEIFNDHYTKLPLYGVRLYNSAKDQLMDQINGGLLIINTVYLESDIYQKLIKHSERGFKMVEQDALNDYFRDKIGYLPKEYNVEKRMLHSKKYQYKFDGSDAKIVHFVATKPWDNISKKKGKELKYKNLEVLWWSYYEKAKDRYTSV